MTFRWAWETRKEAPRRRRGHVAARKLSRPDSQEGGKGGWTEIIEGFFWERSCRLEILYNFTRRESECGIEKLVFGLWVRRHLRAWVPAKGALQRKKKMLPSAAVFDRRNAPPGLRVLALSDKNQPAQLVDALEDIWTAAKQDTGRAEYKRSNRLVLSLAAENNANTLRIKPLADSFASSVVSDWKGTNWIMLEKLAPSQGHPTRGGTLEAAWATHLSSSSSSSSPVIKIVLGPGHCSTVWKSVNEEQEFAVSIKAEHVMVVNDEALLQWTHAILPTSRDFLPRDYSYGLNYDSSDLENKQNKNKKLCKVKRSTVHVITLRSVPGEDSNIIDALTACRLSNVPVDQMATAKTNSLKRRKLADVITDSLPSSEETASAFEQKHVHAVYDTIAQHFSDTRYKPWPQVVRFLEGLPDGARVADVGCGNGKYMAVNPELRMEGCDMSANLVEICKQRGFDVVEGDTMDIPFESETYDAVLSIAVFHHISTEQRRLRAMRELLRLLKPGGTLLLCAWAKEQKEQDARRKFDATDVWVEWNLPVEYKEGDEHASSSSSSSSSQRNPRGQGANTVKYQRYCHVYLPDELESLFRSLPDAEVLDSNYDTGNYFVYVQKKKVDVISG